MKRYAICSASWEGRARPPGGPHVLGRRFSDGPAVRPYLGRRATDTGRPYFVLELVRGVRITDFCAQNNLPTVERLKLFIQVCHAIQHAHQKGIIHRDIKPSNVLVSMHDDVWLWTKAKVAMDFLWALRAQSARNPPAPRRECSSPAIRRRP